MRVATTTKRAPGVIDMDQFRKAVGGILLAIMLLSAHGFGYAASHNTEGEMTAKEAAALVQRRTGGQALGVKEDIIDGRKVYRVRVFTRDGRVREVTVDAKSNNR